MKQRLVNYTNRRLNQYFEEVKNTYNVIGNGTASITETEFIINYTVDGENKTWTAPFWAENMADHTICYFFNCWLEEM